MFRASLVFALVAALAVCAQAKEHTAESRNVMRQYINECSRETGLKKDVLAKARKGNFTPDTQFKEYAFCLGIKLGFLNGKAEVQEDVVIAKTPELSADEVRSILRECDTLDRRTTSLAEVAYHLHTCAAGRSPRPLLVFTGDI